jgi:hypothetical protein
MRNPTKPNLRLQDGVKEKLLCFECEQKFGQSEKWFAENIFHPFLAGEKYVFAYDEQFGRFVVSVLWRIALVSKDHLHESPAGLRQHLTAASEEWRLYLNKGTKPSSYHQFHFLLLPDGWGGVQPHEYVARYFNRDVDGHIIEQGGECWVYVKFARFMFFGRIAGDIPSFRNTEVQLGYGSTLLGQYIARQEVVEYLLWRSEAIYKHAQDAMSVNQHNVILDYFQKNYNRIQAMDLGKRLEEDSKAEIKSYVFDSSFRYVCDCCGKAMVEPEGYLLRTFEILLSKKFLQYYFNRNGLTTTKEDLELRQDHVSQLASYPSPWMICDDCITMFDLDLEEVKSFAVEWIKSKGEFIPPKSDNFRDHLTSEQIDTIAYTIVTV